MVCDECPLLGGGVNQTSFCRALKIEFHICLMLFEGDIYRRKMKHVFYLPSSAGLRSGFSQLIYGVTKAVATFQRTTSSHDLGVAMRAESEPYQG